MHCLIWGKFFYINLNVKIQWGILQGQVFSFSFANTNFESPPTIHLIYSELPLTF